MKLQDKIKKTPLKLWVLLGAAIIFDFFIEPALGFAAVMCTIPSITGIGIIATLTCYAALIGSSILFGLVALFITKRKLEINSITLATAIEAVPILNFLPIFTAATIYYIWFEKK